MSLIAFLGAIESGLLFGLVAIGVFLSFRILDFPDLTVDGGLPLGAPMPDGPTSQPVRALSRLA